MSTIYAQVAPKGCPMFDGTDYRRWKIRAMFYLKSVDSRMEEVIRNGPIIPTITTPGTDTTPAREVLKPRAQWSDEERKLYALDDKAISILANAISNTILDSVSSCSTSKGMWDTLAVTYEGTNIVKEQKKNSLTRQYENFFTCRDESLTDTFTRFNL